MLFRYCVAWVAWTSATGTASRDPTPPGVGMAVRTYNQGLENVRDDNYALQVIARLQLNGASTSAGLRSPLCKKNASFHQKIMVF